MEVRRRIYLICYNDQNLKNSSHVSRLTSHVSRLTSLIYSFELMQILNKIGARVGSLRC